MLQLAPISTTTRSADGRARGGALPRRRTRRPRRRNDAWRDAKTEHDALPIPNGWFAVAWSRELTRATCRPLFYFGQELVLFRTRSGQARVLDAYCPHLGAHLGQGGRVIGETVRCPFHGWQYDGTTGACVHIPYCERIPRRRACAPGTSRRGTG